MTIYRVMGNAIIEEDELITQQEKPSFKDFKRGKTRNFTFTTGVLEQGAKNQFKVSPASDLTPFLEIGPSKPLVVEIRNVYTGKYPKRDRKMLVTSAMKSLTDTSVAPRAINFMTQKDVESKSNNSIVAAVDPGSPLIYYTPALTKPNSTITVDMGFDAFNGGILRSIASIFKGAGELPIFAPISSFLMGAGEVLNLGKELGDRFLESKPVFSASDPITFLRGGSRVPEAGFRLITESDFPVELRDNYQVSPDGYLVDKSGRGYDGDIPYVVISLDGRKIDSYVDFEPLQASAGILEDFFNLREGQDQDLGVILNGLKLINDLSFRSKADKLAEQIAAENDAEKKNELETQFDAFVANIREERLRP